MSHLTGSLLKEVDAGTTVTEFLSTVGLAAPTGEAVPDSAKRFPDGAHYRLEIPSTEGPAVLQAVLDEADSLGVQVHRVSQGSGVFMLTDDELDEMAELGATAGVEVSLFSRPSAGWGTSVTARSAGGATLSAAAHGHEQVRFALDDIRRAADHGIRSVLIADLGVLSAFGAMRRAGLLPADMQAKVSALLAVSNPLTAKVLVDLGATTLNVPSDLTLSQLAAIRRTVDVPLDIYIEAPDSLGGIIRTHDLPEVVRVAAPIYAKFGLRNAPDVYPSGRHICATLTSMSRERVRRAKLALELMERAAASYVCSGQHPDGLAVPTRTPRDDR